MKFLSRRLPARLRLVPRMSRKVSKSCIFYRHLSTIRYLYRLMHWRKWRHNVTEILKCIKNILIKIQIKDVSRVSTPDSVYEEKIFDQFREKLNNSFHFKNVEMETELPYVNYQLVVVLVVWIPFEIDSIFSQPSPSLQKKTTHTAPTPNQFKDKPTPRYKIEIYGRPSILLESNVKHIFQFGVWYWGSSLGSIFWMSSMAGNCCRPFTCRCKIKETIQIFKTQASLDYVVWR